MAEASFEGYENIRRKLQQMLDGKPQALKAAGVVLLTEAQKSITQGGNGWPGFARQPKRAHQLLWDYGTLLRSLAVGDTNNVFQEDGDSITIGSSVDYARAQNLGNPAHDLPARPYLFVDEARLRLAETAFMNQLKKAWDR